MNHIHTRRQDAAGQCILYALRCEAHIPADPDDAVPLFSVHMGPKGPADILHNGIGQILICDTPYIIRPENIPIHPFFLLACLWKEFIR